MDLLQTVETGPGRLDTRKGFQKFYIFFRGWRAGLLVVLVYFLIGLIVLPDYGISIDETIQRQHTMINLRYIFDLDYANYFEGGVLPPLFASAETDLQSYTLRYYGVALQLVVAAVEYLFDFQLTGHTVFLMRHFLNHFCHTLAALCMFFLLRRRYGDSFLPLVGVLMFLLYPRFFAESMYNIKDLLFLDWYLIAAYFGICWLQERSRKYALLFALSAALATNTRILGFSLILLAAVYYLCMERWGQPVNVPHKGPLWLVFLVFTGFYVLITPAAWENPIKTMIGTFMEFSNYDTWDGVQLYMGEYITSTTPWHFLPVHMLAGLPPLYIALFVIGCVAVVVLACRQLPALRSAEGRRTFFSNQAQLADLFFFFCFFCTILVFILGKVRVYTGWRHIYFLFVPFIYLAVCGLHYLFRWLASRSPIVKWVAGALVGVNLMALGLWIVVNHPYQYAYISPPARTFARENLEVVNLRQAHKQCMEYILAIDDRPEITVAQIYGYTTYQALPQEDLDRTVLTYKREFADYLVRHGKTHIEDPEDCRHYELLKTYSVDGHTFAAVYKNKLMEEYLSEIPPLAAVEGTLINWNENEGLIDPLGTLTDGTLHTAVRTPEIAHTGDYLELQFPDAVDYNLLHLPSAHHPIYSSLDLEIQVSMDGEDWQVLPPVLSPEEEETGVPLYEATFLLPDTQYRCMRIVNKQEGDYIWSVGEIRLGNIPPEVWFEEA
ncbi:hypothetical protein LJC49_09555 [Ruminococcaceae bacterium OttesenSCG-928-I18]|nr:hypothetical protein [Ruminococcaceae bacterium OttesenSCG-928-I18]